MTRINTNVSSLIAQKTLVQSNASLQQALTRLSTGLRINTGKDDPAGLIASEELRSDMVSVQTAISNAQRANQVIAIADSALGQVSSLLNDIRGLVTEAANTGAMSEDQIAANQVQVDSALEALNRISQTTSFQGRRLLDGSLDFVHTAGTIATIEDLQIDQANFGTATAISVSVNISAAATQATLNSTGFSAAANANATINFAAGEQLAAGAFVADAATAIDITATSLDSSLSGVDIVVTTQVGLGPSTPTAVYNAAAGTLTITIDAGAVATTAADVVAAINNQTTEFSAVVIAAGTGVSAGSAGTVGTTGVDSIAITAATAGPDFNDVAVSVATSAAVTVLAPTAVYDNAQNTLAITINNSGTTTLAAVTAAIAALPEFGAVATANGSTTLDGAGADPGATANTDGTGGRTLLGDLVAQISGDDGSEVFSFQAGASINQITNAINLVSDATGVAASFSGGTLTLNSTAYGTDAFVDVDVIEEGLAGQFVNNLSATRATGTDIIANVNGIAANGDGNAFSINTATLDLSITVSDGSSAAFGFDITGGGSLFQLGPDVVSNQQARFGIQSVNAASLRGVSGRLYRLGSGESAELATNPTLAAQIVDQVIDKVTSLRGRLGAFQKTTLETNINSLRDTLENLTEAESMIRDADFAAETAALTRAQILVQSGTSVLAIANSNPQNVLALLR
ncbi:MAG: flagellin [Planctomycetota bacterium]|jgi:flagellin